MAARKVLVNAPLGRIRVVPTATAAAGGDVDIGQFDQATQSPNAGVGPSNHVLFHFVEALMIKAKLFDYARYNLVLV